MSPQALAVAAALSLVFAAAKLSVVWPFGRDNLLFNWLAVSALDVLFALCLGAASSGVDLWLVRHSRSRKRFHLATRSFAVLCAVYAVANISIFAALNQPLNSRVLSMMKQVGDMQSSLAVYLDWKLWVWLVCAPTFAWWGSRYLERYTARTGFRRGFYGVTGVWLLWGGGLLLRTEPDAWQRRAGRNAHSEILYSLLADSLSSQRVEAVGPFPESCLEDFKPAAERKRGPEMPAPRNVIVFVLESTSAQYLSLYGADYDTTPNLCAEAGNALVMDRAYAHVGFTFCSFITLTYSVYPGLPWQYRPGGARPMTEGMASLLKKRGYRTGYFSAANPEWGGMDFMARQAGIDDVFGPDQLAPFSKITSWGCDDAPMLKGLVRWIDRAQGRPFYAVAWTDQTHHPYTVSKHIPAADFFDNGKPVETSKGRYLNAIRQSDHHLGQLFAALRKRGLDKDTLVVVTGDHGESFGHPHPVMGHGSALFDENLRVPLMFWSPRLFAGGQRIQKPVGHVDVNPTLADLLKLPMPADWQGCSVLSEDHPGRVYFMADRDGFQFGVLDQTQKALFYATAGYERLYDLANDPLEQRNLSSERPEAAAALRARISAFIQSEEAYLRGDPPVPTTSGTPAAL